MKALSKCIGLSFMVLILLGACSPKVTNEKIDRLESREELLEKTTELNKLRLELERNTLKQEKLNEEVRDINQQASASAREAEELSARVSRNPGEAGLAKRADRASSRAASDAKKARKLAKELEEVNDKVKDLRKDIEETEKDLDELKAKEESVPNN